MSLVSQKNMYMILREREVVSEVNRLSQRGTLVTVTPVYYYMIHQIHKCEVWSLVKYESI